ncbi:uncharacterized protein N7469_001275 [Penicillium citrinum]|uniref:RRM domain-containing protein n=2 Tax=Penicillium TaxID=5073 RepID=A0A9W9TVQ9_PENCI|nr:uncharacterized protein N7469_001275 [Penicillium citrinum]KAJ5242948.1 hypothetical protein N7469_001275 [Penicillium citrinum]KAJ5599544.1 hypothetical protein N7450_000611 [Penicillium hetheringtonii]KAK5806433.1 hypothetical protein VI817_000691 [Penicillium citrinum]
MAKKQASQAPSFDEIIQSDRQKKQNELLASQILGKDKNKKGRRASAPGSGAGALSKAQTAKPGSLASRIGPANKLKRSASASFRTSQPQPKTKVKTNPAPATVGSARSREKPTQKKNRNHQKEHPHQERLLSLVQNTQDSKPRHVSSGLSIKGASGPFVVVASNFAPGTSAADIQSALESNTGPMLSCRVINHSPSVTAEITYAEKWTAENTVANFNNQRADGRLLSFKLNPIGGNTNSHVNTQNSFNDLREQADRDRRNRRADPQLQDGSYGFGEEGQALDSRYSNLYSDRMMVDSRSHSNQNRRRRA